MTTTDEAIDQTIRDLGELRRFLNRHGLTDKARHEGLHAVISTDRDEYERVCGLAAFERCEPRPYPPPEWELGDATSTLNSSQLRFGVALLSVQYSEPIATELPFDAPGRVVVDGVGL